VFTGTTYHPDEGGGGVPRFGYAKADRRVIAYYFYLVDEVFGPAFVKICAYFPYPLKINGHEYAKRAAAAAGIGFTELANEFAATDDPAGLQRICDMLGPGTIRVFCERWWARLPLPLTEADRAAGYWWDISMRQVEVSRTIVFDAPHTPPGPRVLRGAVRRQPRHRPTGGDAADLRPASAYPPPGGDRTKLLRTGDEITLNAYFRHSRVKSYLKCGRAFRIETVVNDTGDLGVARRREHLEELFGKARDVNRRMVDAFRVGQGCVLASPAFERAARPTLEEGRRAPALRFGDPRVMALAGALRAVVHTITGFTNRSLRAQVSTLLGVPYSMGQMSYNLRRLRLKGLITRLPRTNTYVLTPDGQRVAIFYTKVHNRLLRPLLAAHDPPAPLPLRQALWVINHHVDDYVNEARMAA